MLRVFKIKCIINIVHISIGYLENLNKWLNSSANLKLLLRAWAFGSPKKNTDKSYQTVKIIQ